MKIVNIGLLIVISGSMEPEIEAGEMIIIKEQSNYEIGDIITYCENGKYLVTHRIIDKNKQAFITKGDSNNIQDDEIAFNQIEGKVVFHSKTIGFFLMYCLKPSIFLYSVIIIIINVKFRRESKRNDDV